MLKTSNLKALTVKNLQVTGTSCSIDRTTLALLFHLALIVIALKWRSIVPKTLVPKKSKILRKRIRLLERITKEKAKVKVNHQTLTKTLFLQRKKYLKRVRVQ